MTDKQWIHANKTSLTATHPHKWIAVKNSVVVAVADGQTAALRAALASGVSDPALFKAR